jgi:hypothetical protein
VTVRTAIVLVVSGFGWQETRAAEACPRAFPPSRDRPA